jgi:hypothetical protein
MLPDRVDGSQLISDSARVGPTPLRAAQLRPKNFPKWASAGKLIHRNQSAEAIERVYTVPSHTRLRHLITRWEDRLSQP